MLCSTLHCQKVFDVTLFSRKMPLSASVTLLNSHLFLGKIRVRWSAPKTCDRHPTHNNTLRSTPYAPHPSPCTMHPTSQTLTHKPYPLRPKINVFFCATKHFKREMLRLEFVLVTWRGLCGKERCVRHLVEGRGFFIP